MEVPAGIIFALQDENISYFQGQTEEMEGQAAT